MSMTTCDQREASSDLSLKFKCQGNEALDFSEYLKYQLTPSSPRHIPKRQKYCDHTFNSVWHCFLLSWSLSRSGTHASSLTSFRRMRDPWETDRSGMPQGGVALAHLWRMGHFVEGGKDKASLATEMRMSKARTAGLVCLSRSFVVRIMREKVWVKG